MVVISVGKSYRNNEFPELLVSVFGNERWASVSTPNQIVSSEENNNSPRLRFDKKMVETYLGVFS